MRDQGLQPCQPRPWRASLTDNDGSGGPIPDLVDRDFTADAPGEKMVGDITYIPTWEGWLYLATVIDCHTKMVIGYAMDDNYKTPLIIDAVRMAARNVTLADGAIFHSDRGSNYTSEAFAGALTDLGIRQSVGRTGICYDNAMAESFFATLKNELVHRTAYPTRQHAATTSRATSNCGTIPDESTQVSVTEHHRRSATSGLIGKKQHKCYEGPGPKNEWRTKSR